MISENSFKFVKYKKCTLKNRILHKNIEYQYVAC